MQKVPFDYDQIMTKRFVVKNVTTNVTYT